MAERRSGWLLNGHHHHGQGDQGQAQPLGLGGQLGKKNNTSQRRDRWSSGLNREGAARSQPAQGREVEAVTHGNANPPRWPAARDETAPGSHPPAPEEHERQLQRQGQQVLTRFSWAALKEVGRRRQRLLASVQQKAAARAARTPEVGT